MPIEDVSLSVRGLFQVLVPRIPGNPEGYKETIFWRFYGGFFIY